MSVRFLIVGTAVSLKLLPNTLFLDKYRKFRATYNFDESEKPVQEKIKQRFMDVMNDLNVPEKHRRNINIFSVHDINMFRAGSTWTSYGAMIGIPPNFEYEDAEKLSIEQINIETKHLPWTEETSNLFLHSVVLSENAQKFAMGREILKVQRVESLFLPLNLGMDCIITFALHDMLYATLKIPKGPNFVNFALKTAMGLLGLVIWLISEEVVNTNIDQEVTKQLVKLSPAYMQGAKEFFNKLCEREEVMAYFLGEQGARIMRTTWIKRTEIPPCQQLEFLNSQLQEIEVV